MNPHHTICKIEINWKFKIGLVKQDNCCTLSVENFGVDVGCPNFKLELKNVEAAL